MSLTKAILAGRRKKPAPVNLPDYPEFNDLTIRHLSLAEVRDWATKSRAELSKSGSLLLVACLCDEDGKRLYKDGDEQEVADSIDGDVAAALVKEALRINKLNQDEKTPAALAVAAKS